MPDDPTPTTTPVPDRPADPLELARQLDALACWSGNGPWVADLLRTAAAYLRRIPGLEAEVERLRAALEPFVGFLGWIEAAAEIGDINPLTDNTVVASLMAGGGSDYLWVADLRNAREALIGQGGNAIEQEGG